MSTHDLPATLPGWTVGQSMAWELDAALSFVISKADTSQLPEDLAALWYAAPADWRADSAALLGLEHFPISLIGIAAAWAGVLHDDDYARVTLAVRTLTAPLALAAVVPVAAAYGETTNAALAPAEQLVDLATRLAGRLYQSVGFDVGRASPPMRRTQRELQHVVRILHDGDLHAPFWHWLDRFYYEVYRPWRAGRAPAVELAQQHAVQALGAARGLNHPPAVDWLPAHNPLLRYPELHAAVAQGSLQVFFWVEPFGLADYWGLQPGVVVLSFAEPGGLYAGFAASATRLASRVAALSDPTRLIILRLIRNFGMINTEVADFLQLARPTVSIHAKILREAGFIRSTPRGREVRHELVSGEVRALFQDLARFLDLPADE